MEQIDEIESNVEASNQKYTDKMENQTEQDKTKDLKSKI